MLEADQVNANAETNPDAKADAGENKDTESNKPETKKADESNDRLLKESKEYKRKYQELKAKADDEARQKAVEEGRLKELLEQSDAKAKELQKKLMRTSLDHSLRAEAAKAGCTKPDALFRLGDLKLVEFDEDGTVTSGADLVVQDVKKNYPELFKTAMPPNINSATPGGPTKGPLSYEEWLKLPLKEQQKRIGEVIQS